MDTTKVECFKEWLETLTVATGEDIRRTWVEETCETLIDDGEVSIGHRESLHQNGVAWFAAGLTIACRPGTPKIVDGDAHELLKLMCVHYGDFVEEVLGLLTWMFANHEDVRPFYGIFQN